MNQEQPSADKLPSEQMVQMVSSYWLSQALGAVARLGIPDRIAAQPRTSEGIAKAVGIDPDAAHRVMRALASIGVFRQLEDARFALTPLGETLCSNVPGSVRDFAVMLTDTPHWQAWGKFLEALKSGRPVLKAVLGMELWEWYSQHSGDANAFSLAMGNLARMVAAELTRVVDFSQVQTVADVGGAHGVLLTAILQHYPHTRGILFDLPHVIETAKPVIEAQGLSDRCELSAGDFFNEVPSGADVHVLKQILHDWDDQRATLILENCRRSLRPNGRVLLVEMVLPPDSAPSPAHFIDLNMLVLLGGRERSASEFAVLLEKSGFKPPRFIETDSPFVVIEAKRG
jgi:hypothetical protein